MLDDLFMVRSAGPRAAQAPVELYAPESTVMMKSRGWSSDPFEADNPEPGVPLYYRLPEGIEGPLEITILDTDGHTVRRYSSEEGQFERCLIHNMDPRSPYEPEYPSVKAGLNRWNWDLNRQGFTCVEDMTLFAGLEGPTAMPGAYTARIKAGGHTAEAGFSIRMDPRISASTAELADWSARLDETAALLEGILSSLGQLRKAEGQIRTLMADYPANDDLQQAGRDALAVIEAWDHEIIQPLHETYEDEDAWETRLAGQVRHLLDVIDSTGAPVTEGALLRLRDLQNEWAVLESRLETIRSEHIDPINAWARNEAVPHVSRE